MNANASVRAGSWQQRWADPALTVLAVELAVAIFIIAPLGVLAPRSGLVLPLLLTALVLTPALLAAVLVASDNGTARAAVFVAIVLIVSGIVVGLHRPSVLVTYLHMIGALIMGCALIWVVAHAVFAPGRVTYHRIVGTLLLYLMIGATFAGLYGTLGLLVPHPFRGMPYREDGPAVVAHVLYFSFATLTSVGYGDVIPMHPLTRGLSNLEAVIGQLFPATLIARMVTLHLSGLHRGERSDEVG
jgi:NADH:ubiquinone oxidoreductase subunit K